ncbi:MAG TPA: hypothetical protein DGX96_12045 [Lachnospiraceae bacterium]|nr:hypothetical protein [Lachnospiraceae bacterium]
MKRRAVSILKKAALALVCASAIVVSGIPRTMQGSVTGTGVLAKAASISAAGTAALVRELSYDITGNRVSPSSVSGTIETDAATTADVAAGTFQTGAVCDQYMSDTNYQVLINVIGAIETGGQIYGQRDYSMYVGPFQNSSNEYTITLGWCSFYGDNAQKLVRDIILSDPAGYVALDPNCLILQALTQNWVNTQYSPSDTEKQILISLITSDVGKRIQDLDFLELAKSYMNDCISRYAITDPEALMMYTEISLLGGLGASHRVFDRVAATGASDVMTILNCLFQDNPAGTQVGSSMYYRRHLVAACYIMAYTAY